VILHTARLTDTEYEWVQHEAIARLVGVGDEKVRAVQRGATDDGALEPRESLALRLVGQLLEDGAPAPDLVTEVASELGRAELIELLIVAGYYAMLGGLMRAVQLDVDSVLEKGMLDRERLSGGG